MYINESIKTYLDDLGARKSAPGGGSAAGLSGAIGTALLEMVCNFTLGKKKYKDVGSKIKKHLEDLAKLKNSFEGSIDEDVKVYREVRESFKSNDPKRIEDALKNSYGLCLNICERSRIAMDIASDLANIGNADLITDVGCGADMLMASFNSGAFNCEINLKFMKDRGFAEKEKERLADYKDIEKKYKEVILKTKERMK
ncbi:MAG: cyclodeaminase/cyclohydrolase family protein [Candidatus Omnitrophota bacterium]